MIKRYSELKFKKKIIYIKYRIKFKLNDVFDKNVNKILVFNDRVYMKNVILKIKNLTSKCYILIRMSHNSLLLQIDRL